MKDKTVYLKNNGDKDVILHEGVLYIFGETTLEVDFVTITDESQIPADFPFKRPEPKADKE